MADTGFTLFETAIGHCGIAWGERGVLGLQLPEKSAAATRRRMRTRFPGAVEEKPPRAVTSAIGAITKLLSGKHIELDHVELDMEAVSPFYRRVYEAARRIKPGRTMSYGEVATRLGSPNASRAVGQAMRRNPFPIVVPCHRVLASAGKPGGFTAAGGVDTKLRLLEIEGAAILRARDNARKLVAAARKAAMNKPTSLLARKPAASRATLVSVARPAVGKASPSVTKPSPSGGRSAPALVKYAAGSGGLAFDPKAAVRELRAADAALARVIDSVGPPAIRIRETATVFGALAESIVYQQLTGKAAATIYGRVCALFPRARGGFTPAHILDADDAALRGAGLSGSKVAALRDLAAKTASREIPGLAQVRRMDDQEIVDALTSVRGIGRWTVEMLLIFRLGRPDVLPVDDYGVCKGFAVTYRRDELPTTKELALFGEKWRPYRTVASWYMWRAADAAKEAKADGRGAAKAKA